MCYKVYMLQHFTWSELEGQAHSPQLTMRSAWMISRKLWTELGDQQCIEPHNDQVAWQQNFNSRLEQHRSLSTENPHGLVPSRP